MSFLFWKVLDRIDTSSFFLGNNASLSSLFSVAPISDKAKAVGMQLFIGNPSAEELLKKRTGHARYGGVTQTPGWEVS